ncbi:helix-turn-helix domain-containing protein [Campylobacter sp. CCUG 57310]|uniref:helix-turn-helix domain-containing protein n=1 Tax=Campylobacter sp. CCUG 57310 TaxID=2517362 RepID=UPI001564678A|nr:helix-turn-helix domain-containing protein [Campylobacter sp. CCUG 57310]QKF93128.1 hypothetical protein CORI_1975 [Campylobacter sp. CCUG 57310]
MTLKEIYAKDNEVAEIIGVSKNTLAKWRMSKNKGPKLPFVKIGRNILYKRDSIKQWLEDNERIDTKNLKQTKDSK